MAVPVNIYVSDDSADPQPIAGVSVLILTTGGVPAAAATTDVTGLAALSLLGSADPGTAYEVRLFKLGVIFGSPSNILVQEPTLTTNDFDLSGHITPTSVSIDPRTCRCTGRFMNLSNQPISNATVRIMAKAANNTQAPKILDGNIISAEAASLKTDSNGFISVDLIRNGEFYITYAGEDEDVWNFKVPDRSSVNLIDLIHPHPTSYSWDQVDAPANVVSINQNETKGIGLSVAFSDFISRTEDLVTWLQFDISDPSLVSDVHLDNSTGKMWMRGIAPGTLLITPSIVPNLLPIRVPASSMTETPLTVTVLP